MTTKRFFILFSCVFAMFIAAHFALQPYPAKASTGEYGCQDYFCDDGLSCTYDYCDGDNCAHDSSACGCQSDSDCGANQYCWNGSCYANPGNGGGNDGGGDTGGGGTQTPPPTPEPPSGGSECSNDSDCNDNNTCTSDYCSNGYCNHSTSGLCTGDLQTTSCFINLLGQSGNAIGVNAYATCQGYGCNLVNACLYVDWGDGTVGATMGCPGWGGAATGDSHTYTSGGTYTVTAICGFDIYPGPHETRHLAGSFSVDIPGGPPIEIGHQCSDGIDNDGNGLVDYPNDCGCSSYTDNTESGGGNCFSLPKCSDGIDNDGDGLIDYPNDCGCASAAGNSELNAGTCGNEPPPGETPGPTPSGSVTPTPTPNNPPIVFGVRTTEPNYCASAPAAFVSWSYTDPEHNPQSAYQVQVATDASFTSPIVDTGKLSGSATEYASPVLPFNATYYAHVRAWDATGAVSPWTTMTLCTGPGCAADQRSWTAPKHAYPSDVDVSWTPEEPTNGQEITFSKSTTTCHTAPPFTTPLTATFYSDPGNPGATSTDGFMTRYAEGDGAFYAAYGASSGTVDDTYGQNSLLVMSRGGDSGDPDYILWWYISRALLNFNTSTLPADATIAGATLSVHVNGANGGPYGCPIAVLVGNTGTSNNSYSAGDYGRFGTTWYDPNYHLMCNGVVTFTLNATGLAAISKTGVTKLAIRDDYEVRDIGGNDGSFLISSADSGSNKPVLTITYTVPPPAPTQTCASYTWNFNDGSPAITSPDETQTHTYTSAGAHTISFSAQDAEGYSCPTTPAAKPLSGGGLLFPKWKEVLP